MQTPNDITAVLERLLPVGSIVEWSPVDSGKADLSTPEKVAAYYGFGTWEAYGSGRMLLGVSDGHAIGSTGGEETHTLVLEELPEKVTVGYTSKYTAGHEPVITGLFSSAIRETTLISTSEGRAPPFLSFLRILRYTVGDALRKEGKLYNMTKYRRSLGGGGLTKPRLVQPAERWWRT